MTKRDIGQRLREARREQGISPRQIAIMAEFPETYVGKIERGEFSIANMAIVHRIAKCLGVSLKS